MSPPQLAPASAWLCLLATATAQLGPCRTDSQGYVECTAPGQHLTLGAGLIPVSAVSVHIHHAENVTVLSNTTLQLPLLRNITISDILRLRLLSHSLHAHAASTLGSLCVRRVRSAALLAGALAGRWSSDADVTMSDIARLECDGRALAAPLAQVTLSNVSLARCRPGTFSAKLSRVLLTGSRLGAAEPLCFRLRRGGQLELRDTYISQLRPLAMQARLSRLSVSGGRLGVLQSRAISGRISKLALTGCRLAELRPLALDAAVQELQLRTTALDRLHAGALAGLRRTERLSMRSVSMTRLDAAALYLNSSVSAAGLSVQWLYLDTPCRCDMVAEARRLTGVDGSDSAAAGALARLLVTDAFCSTPGQPAVLARFCEVECGAAPAAAHDGGSPAPAAAAAGTSADQTAVFAVVLAGVSVLMLTAVYLAVTRRRRLVAVYHYLTAPPAGAGGVSSGGGRRRSSSGHRPVPSPRRPRHSSALSSHSSGSELPSEPGSTGGRRARYTSQSSRTELLPARSACRRYGGTPGSARPAQARTRPDTVSRQSEPPSAGGTDSAERAAAGQQSAGSAHS